MKPMILKTAAIFATFAMSSTVFAAMTGRGVGAGLAYPSSHQSLTVNSSVLSEASTMSLQGLWGFDAKEPTVSLVGSQGKIGWGLGWRDRGVTNVFDAGLGVNLGGLMLGADLYSTDFNGFDGDASATIDLGSMRLVTAFRGIDQGVDRVDIGVGFIAKQFMISLDMFKTLPWDSSQTYGFDASFAYNMGKIGFGLGYDFFYLSGIQNGEVHGDVSLSVSSNIAIEGHYRLTPFQAAAINNWSAGARLMF